MFKLDQFMNKRILKSSFLEAEQVMAFFTTRDLPLKHGERKDLIEEVENNKQLICDELNIPLENLVIPIQTHSDNIYIVNSEQETGNRNLTKQLDNVDALITNNPNIALALNFADCVPIILYDPVKKVVAIVHAGWRGTVAKIASKTVEKMIENFNVNPQDIIALIGPCISKCCFEVKEDVLQKLLQSVDNQEENVFYNSHVDLKLINKLQLLASGVIKIDLCEYCTCCQNELFFSYRKENGKTARHSAVIILKN